jgi:sulfite reductase (NADPH) hemoprotein beta-component
MYRYDEFDDAFCARARRPVSRPGSRRLDGSLTEDEFKPLRLKNGVYLQLHAYMLRIAIPYGTLSSKQLRQLALIGERYDRGYGHFTTRQNLQFNWPKLRDVPEILACSPMSRCIASRPPATASATSRPIISPAWRPGRDRGSAPDRRIDPAMVVLHPEFSYLPRKFKIAVTGAEHDRAVIKAHDIGLRLRRHPDTHEICYEVSVGGGLGRTPMIGKVVRDYLPKADLLAFLEASCGSITRKAGATTNTRRGSRSSSTRPAPRSSSAASRRSSRSSTGPRSMPIRPRSRASRLFRAADL